MRLLCRVMVEQHYLKLGRDFTFPEYEPRYPRDPSYRLKHYRLELMINVAERSISGVASLTITPLTSGSDTLELDAVEMRIDSVEADGKALEYSYDGAKLAVKLPQKLENEITVRVKYYTKPRLGLHFVLPDEHYPNRVATIWSQGEPEYNRYWLPIYDYPNNKCTSEMVVTLPREFVVVSNGVLVSVEELGELRRWHWRLDKPHSTYLISLAAGLFSEFKERIGDVELAYYVPRGREDDVKRSFGKTGDMLRFFEEYTGVKYPFSRYSQVCVTEFIVGGMENTTATTLTEMTLHDELAHQDYSSDPLVAHELAHQWFGDLVTMRDWSHIWLNESFATYFENLYLLKDKGFDEFIYELRRDLQMYLDEYGKRYSRPIVMRVYKYPEELFDGHAYPKGGLVLHTLKNLVGEESFRRGVKLFLERFAFSNADTEDFRKAMEEASGKNLEWFFEQFIYSAGHPALKASYSWDEQSRSLRLSLKQTQGDDSPSAYNLTLDVALNLEDKTVKHTISIRERDVVLYLPCESKPWHVCIDPEFKVFKALEVDRPLEELIQALRRCEHVYCRLDAAMALGKMGGFRAVEALEEAVKHDKFWGVSATAARALGEVMGSEARDALLRCLNEVKHSKVRNAIVEALGNFKEDREVAEALKKVLGKRDESYYVRAQAAMSLGKIKLVENQETLIKALGTPSHNDVITSGALHGLAELATEEALRIVLDYTRLGKPTPVRISATVALAKFPGRKEVYNRLWELARDEYERVRLAVVQAAREMLDPKLLPMLDYMANNDLNERVKRGARETARKIREQMEKGVEYKQLREELEKIREENRRLAERVARYEVKGV